MPGSRYQNDIDRIIALRTLNGGDYWATKDGKLALGGPFSTIESAYLLHELGYASDSPLLRSTAELIFESWREDGRIRTSPSGAIYPCQTAAAARVLCCLGYAGDPRLQKTFEHLFATQQPDGGWRCNASKFGKGPETESSNPGPTLAILDAFRYTPYLNADKRLDEGFKPAR